MAQIDEAKLPSGSAGYCHFANRYRSTKNHQHMGQHWARGQCHFNEDGEVVVAWNNTKIRRRFLNESDSCPVVQQLLFIGCSSVSCSTNKAFCSWCLPISLERINHSFTFHLSSDDLENTLTINLDVTHAYSSTLGTLWLRSLGRKDGGIYFGSQYEGWIIIFPWEPQMNI